MTAMPTAEAMAPAVKRNSEKVSSVTPVAWIVNGEMDMAEWIATGRNLGTMGRCSQWWLGDWIRYGNARFGERYVRAAKVTGYDVQSLMNMVWVAAAYEISRRREILSWSHHETLASLGEDEQEHWLDVACDNRLSVSDLRTELRAARAGAKVEAEAEAELSRVANGVPVVVEAGPTVLRCPRCGDAVPIPEELLRS
jgi:signal transduction histidine kinase